ncbi:MAG: hypothetical protein HC842_01915 [Cytophagales bacterium]|nr:hypothetical protein [Cytophagales bacterium]
MLYEEQSSDNNPVYNSSYYYDRPLEAALDYGYLIGAGLLFKTGVGAFGLEGRYSSGLGNFYSNTLYGIAEKAQNQVAGIYVYYLF